MVKSKVFKLSEDSKQSVNAISVRGKTQKWKNEKLSVSISLVTFWKDAESGFAIFDLERPPN